MKISIDKLKTTPPNMEFNFCVFGEASEEIVKWCEYWGIQIEKTEKFTNLIIPESLDVTKIFEDGPTFEYMDGFSPNLNKHLHIGHLSNLVIASAFQNLGIVNKSFAILGDTLEGVVKYKDALDEFYKICQMFNYNVNITYYASDMKYFGDLLQDGEGDYEGTKIFDIDGEKMVGIKNDGSTTYFYQDMALADMIDGNILYMVGLEQETHFNTLNKVYSNNKHLPLGLVMIDGEKMSSRKGNVIMAQDFINQLSQEFEDENVVINIIMGLILSSKPTSIKNIKIDQINNPKTSGGLYLSYTMARLKSAGLKIVEIDSFNSKALQYAFIKSKIKLNPNILFNELVELSKTINGMYGKYTIKDNEDNQKKFQPLLNDLSYGMHLLGMNEVDKI